MFLAIAAIFFVCAASCSLGLQLANARRNWWPASAWPDEHVVRGHVPVAAKRIYFLNSVLISVGFLALAFWASRYERDIGRLPVLTTLCFFIAFINASIAMLLAGRVEPTVKPAPQPAGFERNEAGRPRP